MTVCENAARLCFWLQTAEFDAWAMNECFFARSRPRFAMT
jgi:hypothetical protein